MLSKKAGTEKIIPPKVQASSAEIFQEFCDESSQRTKALASYRNPSGITRCIIAEGLSDKVKGTWKPSPLTIDIENMY